MRLLVRATKSVASKLWAEKHDITSRSTVFKQGSILLQLTSRNTSGMKMLAGHSFLLVTQRYIDGDSEARRKIGDLV